MYIFAVLEVERLFVAVRAMMASSRKDRGVTGFDGILKENKKKKNWETFEEKRGFEFSGVRVCSFFMALNIRRRMGEKWAKKSVTAADVANPFVFFFFFVHFLLLVFKKEPDGCFFKRIERPLLYLY